MAHILVVEDDVILRYALAEWLRGEGHEVVEAVSGDEATTVLSSIMMVDLVITDVQMPGSLNGLQLARNIRAEFPLLPVIVVSGQPQPATFDEVGASAFFLKPYDFDELTARVAALAPQMIAPSTEGAVNRMSDAPAPGNLAIETVLVVESDVLVRLAIAGYLRDCGYRVIEAASGGKQPRCLRTPRSQSILYSAPSRSAARPMGLRWPGGSGPRGRDLM